MLGLSVLFRGGRAGKALRTYLKIWTVHKQNTSSAISHEAALPMCDLNRLTCLTFRRTESRGWNVRQTLAQPLFILLENLDTTLSSRNAPGFYCAFVVSLASETHCCKSTYNFLLELECRFFGRSDVHCYLEDPQGFRFNEAHRLVLALDGLKEVSYSSQAGWTCRKQRGCKRWIQVKVSRARTDTRSPDRAEQALRSSTNRQAWPWRERVAVPGHQNSVFRTVFSDCSQQISTLCVYPIRSEGVGSRFSQQQQQRHGKREKYPHEYSEKVDQARYVLNQNQHEWNDSLLESKAR